MNFVGLSVRGLDLAAALAIGRLLFLLVALVWLIRLWRDGARAGASGPALLALVWWAVVTFPLQRIYGLQDPSDRLRNLWWCATAAAGNSPFESGVVGQRTLEPAWSLLVSLVSLFDPGRVVVLYPFLSALAIVAVAGGIHFGLRPSAEEGDATPLRVLFASFFVLLAASAPLDYVGPFRSFWSRNFLLKPNHVLGLALVPLAARLLSRWSARRGAALSVLLVLIGWIFVVDWLLLLGGLLVYGLLRLVTDGRSWLPLLARWAAVVAVSVLGVIPYLLFIARQFPNAVSLASGAAPGAPYRSTWGDNLPAGDSLLLMATFDLGPLFALALVGAWRCWQARRPLDLAWLSLLVGAYVAWGLNAVLYYMARARTPDEIYWYLVFVVCLLAGIGASDLVCRLAAALAGRGVAVRGLDRPGRLAVAVLLLWLPFTVPWWWDPVRMDAHFAAALDPVPPELMALGDWLRVHTRGTDVVLAGRQVAVWVPALSGRRVLRTGPPPAESQPYRDEHAMVVSGDPGGAEEARRRLGVDWLIWDPSLGREHGIDRARLGTDPRWREAFAVDDLVVYHPVERP